MRDVEDCLSPTRGTRPGQRRARKTIATIGTEQHVDGPPARIGRKIATPRRSRGTNGEPQPPLCRTALPGWQSVAQPVTRLPALSHQICL